MEGLRNMPIAEERGLKLAALTALCFLASASAHAQEAAPDDVKRVDHDTVSKANEDDIARESENPIGNLTVLPSLVPTMILAPPPALRPSGATGSRGNCQRSSRL